MEIASNTPSITCRSVRHSPVAPTRTITSSGPESDWVRDLLDAWELAVGVQSRRAHRVPPVSYSAAAPAAAMSWS